MEIRNCLICEHFEECYKDFIKETNFNRFIDRELLIPISKNINFDKAIDCDKYNLVTNKNKEVK